MNEKDLVAYIAKNGSARIGSPDTLRTAKALAKKGFVAKVGSIDKLPVYRLTQAGLLHAKSMESKGQKLGRGLRAAATAVQGYATALKENGSASDAFSGMQGISLGGGGDLLATGSLGGAAPRKKKSS